LKPQSEFTRNVLTLMTGTSIAQAIPIAISPILTRIYTPEDFGIFALYMSVAGLISVMATGRYELAIMLPKNDKDAAQVLMLSLMISFFVSLCSLIFVFIFNESITSLLKEPEISSWLYFIPLSVLLTGLYQSFYYWNNRQKKYKNLASTKVSQSIVTSSSNVSLGVASLGSSGLIFSSLIGQAISNIILIRLTLFSKRALTLKVDRLKIMALSRKYKKFPMINSLNAFVDQIRVAGINVLIIRLFGTGTLGQFSLAWKMVQTPLSLISGSLSQVFYQKIARSEKKDLYGLLRGYLQKSVMLSLPIFIGIFLFSVDIFVFIFGVNWELAGQVASLLSPWLFFNFLSAPIAHIFIVLDRQDIVLKVALTYMIAPLFILLGFNNIGFLEVINIISITMSIILIGFIYLAFWYAQKEKDSVVL